MSQNDDHIEREEENPSRTLDAGKPLYELGSHIGSYKLLRILGEGGFGIVYLAQQEHPIKRQVALKIIKPGMDSAQVIRRFEAERQALALLDHPNVAHVYDAGTAEAGRPYFAMEYVKGVPITEHCDRQKLTIEERLKLFVKVCEAIQHAHQKGIIHRDIKPSNIQVCIQDEQAIPKVIDFGVAKALSQPLTERTLVTEQGQLIGTPEYISPEQAEMTNQDIDTRADIYSLGVVLYELLTGTLPFESGTLRKGSLEQMRAVLREAEPKTPSTRVSSLDAEASTKLTKCCQSDAATLRRKLRGDLDWITLKAMEKDRIRRYQTAHALAEDIERHLNQEPVLAGRPGTLYRFQKLVRRNTGVFAAVGTVAVILLIATVVSVSQMISAKRAEKTAEQARGEEAMQRRRAEAEELSARRRAYASDINLAAQALSQDNLGRARDLLNRHRPSPSDPNSVGAIDLPGWEWRYLWKQCQGDTLYELCRKTSEITSLDVSYDGSWLAVGGSEDDGVSVWRLRTGAQLATLYPEERFMRVAFSPRESLLAFSGVPSLDPTAYPRPDYSHSCVRLWDGTSKQIVKELPLEGLCVGLQFSDDGKCLLSSTVGSRARGRITIWSIPEGEKLASYASSQTGNKCGTPFVIDRDKNFAVYARWGVICVMDLSTGQPRWSAQATAEGQEVSALALTPDGKVLASSSQVSEPTIRLWEVASGQELGCLNGHRTWVGDLHFWPNGKTLASASADQTIRLWDVSDPHEGKLARTLRGHTAEVWRITLLPDNKTLVSGAKDGSVYIWDTEKPPRDTDSITLTNIAAWCFTPDGKGILTLDRDGQVKQCRGSGLREQHLLLNVTTDFNPSFTHFSRDNRLLATGSYDGTVNVWDLQSGLRLRTFTCPAATEPFAFLGAGSRLATVSRPADSHDIWDLATGQRTASWPGAARLTGSCIPAFSPDERWSLTLGQFRGTGILRDMRTGYETHPTLEIYQTFGVAFSPNGKYLAACSALGTVKLWETEGFREVATLQRFLQAGCSVAFSPDGKRLAAGIGGLETLKIWDVESHQELLTLCDQGPVYYRTAFSPDGSTLGSMNNAGRLKLWQAPSWEEIEATEKSPSNRMSP